MARLSPERLGDVLVDSKVALTPEQITSIHASLTEGARVSPSERSQMLQESKLWIEECRGHDQGMARLRQARTTAEAGRRIRAQRRLESWLMPLRPGLPGLDELEENRHPSS